MENKMSKQTGIATYLVEGPDWERAVEINTEVFDTLPAQLFEAASQAIEQEISGSNNFNLGAIVIVKKGKGSAKEFLVNAYICLNNASKYQLAENLRKSFKEQSGQDLAIDEIGYSEQ
jgi:hypothetical protein